MKYVVHVESAGHVAIYPIEAVAERMAVEEAIHRFTFQDDVPYHGGLGEYLFPDPNDSTAFAVVKVEPLTGHYLSVPARSVKRTITESIPANS